MAAFCLGDLVPGFWYCACSQTDMAYWYTLYHGAIADMDITPVLFPAMASQNVCCEKALLCPVSVCLL